MGELEVIDDRKRKGLLKKQNQAERYLFRNIHAARISLQRAQGLLTNSKKYYTQGSIIIIKKRHTNAFSKHINNTIQKLRIADDSSKLLVSRAVSLKETIEAMDEAGSKSLKRRTVDEILEGVELQVLNFGIKSDKKIQKILEMLEEVNEYKWRYKRNDTRQGYLSSKAHYYKYLSRGSKQKFLPRAYFVLEKKIKVETRPKPDGTKTYRNEMGKVVVKELINITTKLNLLETNLLNLISMEKLHKV